MEKKLYVHIGTQKTGTTALQHFCVKNAEVLEKKGYCYPSFPYRYRNKSVVRNGVFLTSTITDENGQRLKDEERRIFLEGMEKVKELFSEFDAVILSDEDLWRTTFFRRKELWEELKAYGKEVGFQVVVLVYLRRQDEYLSSYWSQNVKMGRHALSTKTWEEWLECAPEAQVVNYGKRIQEFIEILGRENVIVRKYDRSTFFGGSIYDDFMHAIGLEMTDEYEIVESERNMSLKGNTIEIRRILNTLPKISREDHKFFRVAMLGYADISSKNYPTSVLSKEEIEGFLAPYREGNRYVAKEMLGEEGNLFQVGDNEPPKWQKDNPYMLDDVIRLQGMLTMQLLREREKLMEECKLMENEIEALKGPVYKLVRKIWRRLKRK